MIELHYPYYRNLVNMLGYRPGTYLMPLKIPVTNMEWPGLCNPSVFLDWDVMRLVIRNVNYILHNSIDPYKCWSSWGPVHYLIPQWDSHLKTRNWLMVYSDGCKDHKLIDTSTLDKEPQWDFVGLEDVRLVRWDGKLLAIGVRRDDNTDGKGRMEVSEIDESGKELSRFKIEVPWESYCEKNWVPIIDMPWHFMRTSNPVCIVKINPNHIRDGLVEAEKVIEKDWYDISGVPGIYNAPWQGGTLFRGSSQVIPYKDDMHIALVHTCELYFNEMKRKVAKYLHHFVVWDKDWNIYKISPAFSFNDHHIEFSNGMAYKDGRFYIPFALQDNFSYMLEVSEKDMDEIINGTFNGSERVDFLPNGSEYMMIGNFNNSEQHALWCMNNGYLGEAYCRFWRLWELSGKYPVSPETQNRYLLGVMRSCGWGIRDNEVYNVISLLEERCCDNPEILAMIAQYFDNAGKLGLARTWLTRAMKVYDEDHIFIYITKDEFKKIKNNIEKNDFQLLPVNEYKQIERVL